LFTKAKGLNFGEKVVMDYSRSRPRLVRRTLGTFKVQRSRPRLVRGTLDRKVLQSCPQWDILSGQVFLDLKLWEQRNCSEKVVFFETKEKLQSILK